VIEGKVEGKVTLPNSLLTIGANGTIKAEVQAKSVVVIGRVSGNVRGTERVEIQATGIVEGDVIAPRLVVAEGAVVNGSIQMTSKPGADRTRPGAGARARRAARRASRPGPTAVLKADLRAQQFLPAALGCRLAARLLRPCAAAEALLEEEQDRRGHEDRGVGAHDDADHHREREAEDHLAAEEEQAEHGRERVQRGEQRAARASRSRCGSARPRD
jgi:cytoskeletal protein CcmA (bactofilin family)